MKRILPAGERFGLFFPKNTKQLLKVFPLLLVLISLNSSPLYAQKKVKSMKIGEKLPRNIKIGEFINLEKSPLMTNHLYGKATIIEYWATWCGSCIAAFPKLDSIQKANVKLNIYLVNIEPLEVQKQKVQTALPRIYNLYPNLQLPMIYGDNNNLLYDFTSLPHYLWYDAHGRLKAVTNSEGLKAENIERLIAGLSINEPIKKR